MTTIKRFQEMVGEEPIAMLSLYDTPSAMIADEMGIDGILVGDSMGLEVLGYSSTLPVTLEDTASRTGAVSRGATDSLVVPDMPFLSFIGDERTSIENCARMLKEEGANAVKIRSGPHTLGLIDRLVQIGVPVMAHLGLTEEHIAQLGGYDLRRLNQSTIDRVIELAVDHQQAGAFALVLEHMPADVAKQVTETVDIPTIGYGSGPHCDGQILIFNNVIGLNSEVPSVSRSFGSARSECVNAVGKFRDAVKNREFPGEPRG